MRYKNKTLFIASSSMFPLHTLAFKDNMSALLKTLSLDYVQCVAWSDDDVFRPGYGFLETLDEMKPDYVVALVTPDDMAVIRGKEYIIPRDNVVFEYGLFLGKLGRDKTYLVTPKNTPDLQIMSDLNGVTTVRYQFSPDAGFTQIKDELLSAAFDICRLISQMESKNREPQEDAGLKPDNPKKPSEKRIIFP